MNLFEL